MDVTRELWIRFETVHAVTYFAEESRTAARECGLRGFWMGYFGFHAAPLGRAGPAEVEATFFNFAPAMVRRSIPDAWTFADPGQLLTARMTSAATALQRVAPDEPAAIDDVLPTLATAARAASPDDRPLYAANRALPLPSDPTQALWQACTTFASNAATPTLPRSGQRG